MHQWSWELQSFTVSIQFIINLCAWRHNRMKLGELHCSSFGLKKKTKWLLHWRSLQFRCPLNIMLFQLVNLLKEKEYFNLNSAMQSHQYTQVKTKNHNKVWSFTKDLLKKSRSFWSIPFQYISEIVLLRLPQ